MTRRAAYLAGWNASRRTTTFDLDAAERRFERRHGTATGSMFAAGWTDYASEYPRFTSLREA